MATPDQSVTPRGSAVGAALLVRKDLAVFTPRDRAIVVGAFLLAAIQTVRVEEAYFIVGLVLAGALAVFVPVIEWYQEADPMLHSLPVRRGTVVLARFLTTLSAVGVALVGWASTGWLLRPLLAAGRETPSMWMTLEGVLSFLVVSGLLAALFLPLYFRLGLGRGALAFLVLAPFLALVGYGTAGMAWGPAAGAAAEGAGASIVLPSALVTVRISALVGAVGPGWALAAIMVGMGVALAFSHRLSVRWFEKREF